MVPTQKSDEIQTRCGGVVLHFAGAVHLLLDMFFKGGSGSFPESLGRLAFGLIASGKGFLVQL